MLLFSFISDLSEFLNNLPDLGAWGLWGLFIGTFLAATVVPFSADVLFITMLQMSLQPWACLIVASLGNWLGCMTTFGLGWLGRWDWIEKWFKVDRQKLEKQKVYVDKYGVWLALFSWFPFVGDVITLALGFYKTNPWMTAFLLLVGRTARFLVWALLLGAILERPLVVQDELLPVIGVINNEIS